MVRDSAATRARILAAAVAEFSTYGLAGARIDRIADAAAANKRSIYVYFHDKEQLFHAALQQVLGELMSAVPLTEDDLPGYAGLMFDHLLRHPEAMRLSMWRQLERPTAGPDDSGMFETKIAAMTSGRSAAVASGLAPLDLLVLVNGLATSWALSPTGLLGADGDDPASAARIARHRTAVVEAARRLASPDSSTGASTGASPGAALDPTPEPTLVPARPLKADKKKKRKASR